MPFLLSLVTVIILLGTIIFGPFLTKKITGIKIYLRFAVMGFVVFLFLIDGLSQLVYSSIVGFFPGISYVASLLLFSLVQSFFITLGYTVSMALVMRGKVETASSFSVGYGVAVFQIISSLLATAVSNIYIYSHLQNGTLAAFLAENYKLASVEEVYAFYTAAPVSFLLFIMISGIAFLFVAYALSTAMQKFKNAKDYRYLCAVFAGAFVFTFCFQYLPTINYIVSIIAMVVIIVGSVLACIAMIDD